MSPLSSCPETQEWRRWLRSDRGAGDGERLAEHLEGCSRCSEALDGLLDVAQLTASLRMPAAASRVDESEVERLASRLRDFPPLTGERQLESTAASPTALDAPFSPIDQEAYGLLGPAEAAGEMGRLGPYRVLRVLGYGGMGIVFLAEDPRLRRPVALKAMRSRLSADAAARARFIREGWAAAAVEHEHVVAIHHVGEDRGVPYLAMQLLHGETLDARLLRVGRPPLAEALRIGREVAAGLAAAHAQGLIHRDIKPANIWLEADDDRVKIVDFGLARAAVESVHLTQTGAIVGTPGYMAPEQARGRSLDARCDLFSLGCVLYRMCYGEAPFAGKDRLSTLLAVVRHQPRPPRRAQPEAPPELSHLIMRLLAKDPTRRPPSAREVVAALEEIERPTPRPTRRRPWLPAVATAALLLLAALGAVACWLAGSVFRAPVDEGERAGGRDDLAAPGKLRAAKFVPLQPPKAEKEGEVRTFEGHKNHLVARLSADGRFAVSAGGSDLVDGNWIPGSDFDVRIWEADSGKELRRLKGHTAHTFADFSPDGKRVLTASADKTWCIWDAATGKRLAQFTQDEGLGFGAWSPDGSCVLIANGTKVRLFEADTGKELQAFSGHGGGVESVAFSPDGKRAVSSSYDGTARVWDVATGKQVLQVNDVTGSGKDARQWRVRQAVWSPDGRYLLTCGASKLLKLWDARSGELVRTFEGHKHYVESVSFTPDGKRCVSGSCDATMRLWDVATGAELRCYQGFQKGDGNATVVHVQITRDGRYVLLSSWDRIARLWRLPDAR
jgi:hypothetical protein